MASYNANQILSQTVHVVYGQPPTLVFGFSKTVSCFGYCWRHRKEKIIYYLNTITIISMGYQTMNN